MRHHNHEPQDMLYDDDFCACRVCGDSWDLKKIAPDMWKWIPRFRTPSPKKKVQNGPKRSFRKPS